MEYTQVKEETGLNLFLTILRQIDRCFEISVEHTFKKMYTWITIYFNVLPDILHTI